MSLQAIHENIQLATQLAEESKHFTQDFDTTYKRNERMITLIEIGFCILIAVPIVYLATNLI